MHGTTAEAAVVVREKTATRLGSDGANALSRQPGPEWSAFGACSRLSTAAEILGYADTLETVPWTHLGYAELTAVRAELLRRGKAPSTINATLAALRGVLRTAFGLGLVTADVYLRLDHVKLVKGTALPAGRSLTPAEMGKLLRACRHDGTEAGVRDSAMIMVMGFVGLRRSEMVGLTMDDFDVRRGRLLVRAREGSAAAGVGVAWDGSTCVGGVAEGAWSRPRGVVLSSDGRGLCGASRAVGTAGLRCGGGAALRKPVLSVVRLMTCGGRSSRSCSARMSI